MTKAPAEMMRAFVRSRNFTSTYEIMAAMKGMFKDVIRQVMECELADELGYEKSENPCPARIFGKRIRLIVSDTFVPKLSALFGRGDLFKWLKR